MSDANTGLTDTAVIDFVARHKGGFAEAMIKVGWIVVGKDFYLHVKNFDRHLGSTAKSRGQASQRAQKQGNNRRSKPKAQ